MIKKIQCWHSLVLITIASLVLFGCGQKGPLYLPAESPESSIENEEVNQVGRTTEDQGSEQ